MKKTKQIILSSVLMIALCVSLIAGATFALFSSRSNVNVAITSGKVDVVATVDTSSLTGYSTKWDEGSFSYVQKNVEEYGIETNNFYAGGAYSYSGGELKLEGIAPGDAVEFTLNIENKSTIAIQYRVQLTVPTEIDAQHTPQGEVVKQLKVSFNDETPATIGDKTTFAQKWSDPLEKGTKIEVHPKVRVELPLEVGSEFMGQNCLLHVGVYAVQLGTHTPNEYGTYNVYTASDLLALAKSGETFNGETIALMSDIDLSKDSDGGASTLSIALADTPATIAEKGTIQREWYFGDKDGQFRPFRGTFNGNGYAISGFRTPSDKSFHDDGSRSGFGLFRSTNGAVIENLIVENVMLELDTTYQGGNWNIDQSGRVGIIAGQATNTTFRNIIVRNSSVTSITNYDNKCKMFAGSGNKGAKTLEEYHSGLHANLPLVGYDFVGALAGQIKGNINVENVNITLNEDSNQLTGIKLFGNTPFGDAESALLDSQANQKSNYSLTFKGTSTVVCEPAVGIAETLVFNEKNNGTNEHVNVPQTSVEIGSAEGLASLAQSVKDGRDYSDMTITLTDDIDLGETTLEDIGAFNGTIYGGEEGHTISGLNLNLFNKVASPVSLISAEGVPTLNNVTLVFTKFADSNTWKNSYVYGVYDQSDQKTRTHDFFIDHTKVTLSNSIIALQDSTLRYELHYGEPAGNNNKLVKISYIGLTDEWGDPETGEGYSATIDNEHIIVDSSIEYINIKFTGNTYLNIQGGTEKEPIILTLDHCLADVDPQTVSGNSRAAFIASSGEDNHVKFELTNNTILSANSTYDQFSAAIFSWANTANESKFESNHFGKDEQNNRYKFVAVKLMNFDPNAKVRFTDNDIYGTGDAWEFDAFDLFQNNSRANTYSAIFRKNRVHTVNTVERPHDTYFLYVEANILSNDNPAHGQVYVTSDNYFNDVKVDYAAYDPATFEWKANETAEDAPAKREKVEEGMTSENVLYSYNFVSWKVALNDNDLITSGTFVLGAAFTESELKQLATPDAEIHIYHYDTGLATLDDAYVIDSAESLLKLGQYVQNQEAETVKLNAVLTEDLDMTGVELPAEWKTKSIEGTIEGRGHIIYGIGEIGNYIAKTIFGNMSKESTIRNISFILDNTNKMSFLTNKIKSLFKNNKMYDVLLVAWNDDNTKLSYGFYWNKDGGNGSNKPGSLEDDSYSKIENGEQKGFASLRERLANYPDYPKCPD